MHLAISRLGEVEMVPFPKVNQKTVVGVFSRSSTTDLPYNPEVPLLGIYPKEVTTGTQTDTCM